MPASEAPRWGSGGIWLKRPAKKIFVDDGVEFGKKGSGDFVDLFGCVVEERRKESDVGVPLGSAGKSIIR